MRSSLILLFGLALAFSCAIAIDSGDPTVNPPHDGQPGCRIRFEFRRLWRNNYVPESYWECKEWRIPARERHCPPGTRFQDSWQTCVPFNQWQWTPYSEPPTRPSCDLVDECEEIVIAPEVDPEWPWECPTDGGTTTPSSTTPGDGGSSTPTTPDGGQTTPTPDGGGSTTQGIDTEPQGICPGATDSQHNPGTMSCFRPECTLPQWLAGRLYPTRDPTRYYKCGPGTNNLYIRPCPPGTCFSYHHQVCIHTWAWTNDCE